MKKTIFTYSRKRPTTVLTLNNSHSSDDRNALFPSTTKQPKLAIEDWGNLRDLEANVTIRRPATGHAKVAPPQPSTPQTRRHYETIKETLAKADRNFNFLTALSKASSETTTTGANHQSIYKKLFRLTPPIGHEVDIPDLLAVLRQSEGVLGFDEWLESKKQSKILKIGEATFSEVFCFNGEEVVKIIPLQLDKPINEDVFPLPITISAAIHECKVLRRVAMLKEHRTAAKPLLWTGFNQLLDMRVVKGPFPAPLIGAWKAYSIVKDSENCIPDQYDENDHFLILSLQHGGVDLESFKFQRIEEIQSVICQIACALALAEEKAELEHRDLHLGNVLIKRVDEDLHFQLTENCSFPAKGVICSIIDYSLSRVSVSGGEEQVLFRDLDCLPWLFEGDETVDSQFQVYKDMKEAKGFERSWRDFCPKSNVLWMVFLLERLVLKQKITKLKKPKRLHDELKALAKRAISYPSICSMIEKDDFFLTHLRNSK